MFIITRGSYMDRRNVGTFEGTREEALLLVIALNEARRHVDEYDGAITYKGDEFYCEETTVLRSAVDVDVADA